MVLGLYLYNLKPLIVLKTDVINVAIGTIQSEKEESIQPVVFNF
jgi:hypothetical protein